MTESIFGDISSEGLEKSRDVLGGFGVFETNVYEATIKMAYAKASAKSKSKAVALTLDIDGREYRQDIWITTGEGKNFTIDKTDPKKKNPMMGFVLIDDLCLMATGYPLDKQTIEEKTIPIYDYDAKRELPKNAHVITSILGHKVKVAIQLSDVDKTKLNETTKLYEPTGDTKQENTLEKVFYFDDNRTVSEIREGKEAVFMESWIKSYAGKVRNRVKGNKGNNSQGTAVRPQANGAAAGSSESLFNRK